MNNFYCFNCDKIQGHFNMGTIIESGTILLKCSVCETNQKFTQEDYVKMPKGL